MIGLVVSCVLYALALPTLSLAVSNLFQKCNWSKIPLHSDWYVLFTTVLVPMLKKPGFIIYILFMFLLKLQKSPVFLTSPSGLNGCSDRQLCVYTSISLSTICAVQSYSLRRPAMSALHSENHKPPCIFKTQADLQQNIKTTNFENKIVIFWET